MSQRIASGWVVVALQLALGSFSSYPASPSCSIQHMVASCGLLPNSLAHPAAPCCLRRTFLSAAPRCLASSCIYMFSRRASCPIFHVVGKIVLMARYIHSPCECLGRLLTLDHPSALAIDFALALGASSMLVGRESKFCAAWTRPISEVHLT
jgi:uncharacterized integral membrane protein